MSIWNKVFIGLILVAALPLFYFSARTLKTHQAWRTGLEEETNRLALLTEQVRELRYGTEGVLHWRAQVQSVSIGRGQSWRGMLANANPQTGQVSVTITQPLPHQLPDQKELYIFQDVPLQRDANGIASGGRFLGAFNVVGAAANPQDPVINLVPKFTQEAWQIQYIMQGAGPVVLRSSMPSDKYTTFADLDEAGLRALLPPDQQFPVVSQYIRHGKPALPGDDPSHILSEPPELGNRYMRPLREYAMHAQEFDRQRALWIDRVAKIRHQLSEVQAAKAQADDMVKTRTTQRDALVQELALLRTEETQVKEFRANLESRLARGQQEIERLSQESLQFAEDWEKILSDRSEAIESNIIPDRQASRQ